MTAPEHDARVRSRLAAPDRACTESSCWRSSPCSSPGLMVGRTPEYLGKKLGAHEKSSSPPRTCSPPRRSCWSGTATAMALPGQRAGMLNTGPHGFSEVLYAFTSAANNNGSAFAGIIGQHRLGTTPRLGIDHAARSIPADGLRPRTGRVTVQATHDARVRGHAPDPPAAVRRHADRRDDRSLSPSPTSRRWHLGPLAEGLH